LTSGKITNNKPDWAQCCFFCTNKGIHCKCKKVVPLKIQFRESLRAKIHADIKTVYKGYVFVMKI
jgi:hypothetical protein